MHKVAQQRLIGDAVDKRLVGAGHKIEAPVGNVAAHPMVTGSASVTLRQRMQEGNNSALRAVGGVDNGDQSGNPAQQDQVESAVARDIADKEGA